MFGLALAAPPGPMNAVIAEESVIRGWLAGFKAGLGAMTADLSFFVLALFGAVAFVDSMPLVRGIMVAVGGVLMLYFAYDAITAVSTFVDQEDTTDAKGFWKALVLALTNPYQIIFWLTVGVGLLQPGTIDILGQTPYIGEAVAGMLIVETGSPALVVGFFGGILCWITGFPASLVIAGRRIDRFATAVAYLSALVLGSFGVFFLWDGTETLLRTVG
ncbi:MAG: LysE family translocator [Halobacteriales archaeon]